MLCRQLSGRDCYMGMPCFEEGVYEALGWVLIFVREGLTCFGVGVYEALGWVLIFVREGMHDCAGM